MHQTDLRLNPRSVPRAACLSFKHKFTPCAAHFGVKVKEVKAKQHGYPECRPPSTPHPRAFLTFSCHAAGGPLLLKVISERLTIFLAFSSVYVSYQLLGLTVELLRGRQTPPVLQAEVWRSVEEGIHLRHAAQTGQGLHRVEDMIITDGGMSTFCDI